MSNRPTSGDGSHGGSGMRPNTGSLRTYLIGFVLAAILTAVPFWLVMDDVISNFMVAALVILALAAVQIIVHMIFFLHVDLRSQSGWNLMGLLFTMTLVLIVLGASIWSIQNENDLMMPQAHQTLHQPLAK